MHHEHKDAGHDEFETDFEVQRRLLNGVRHGSRQAVAAALRDGAAPNIRLGSPESLLRLAGEAGHREICELLIEYGANLAEVTGPRRHTPLHTAVISHNYGWAATLLKMGADPSPRTSSGATPLHIAARTGQEYLVRLLLSHDASPTARDNRGRTPADVAMGRGQTKIALMLAQS